MPCHFKNLTTVCLPVILSMLLLPTTSTFGQAPDNSPNPFVAHSDPAAQKKAPPHRPMLQPGAMFEQLKQLGAEQKDRYESILRALKLAVNLLSGNETNLLSGNRPELLSKNEAALLSGNSPKLLSGNKPKILSDNKPKILSDNQTPILSGNRFSLSILSNLKIEIHIENTGNNSGNSGNHAPPPPPHAEPVLPRAAQ
jgi:hypothetical protein